LIFRTLLEKTAALFWAHVFFFFKYLENRDYLAQFEETRAQHSTQYTVHSTQYTAQHTAHSTQHLIPPDETCAAYLTDFPSRYCPNGTPWLQL